MHSIHMLQTSNHTLIDPKTGNLAFKVMTFEHNIFESLQRFNYYTLVWVTGGTGRVQADLSEYEFTENTVLSFSLYQPFKILPETQLKGIVIHFHPDFFCIYKHHKEVACDGVLFNNMYGAPLVSLPETSRQTLQLLAEQMKEGIRIKGFAQYELLVSYLKIFLIMLSRLKSEQYPQQATDMTGDDEPFVLQNLKDCIEAHYKKKHAVSDYADMLAITPKALAKITKRHYKKTVTALISDRIIIEAKRELYLTNKTVKEIAYDLGYNDEYYFSRFFKKNVEVSPQVYRETVGSDRG
ncbi:helix-turn-helix domain-containing protein [Sinomicrobium pectinilyticum]|nr:helix-turn-helix domain-containing protein [Sinomicrobium pectinilyticum]